MTADESTPEYADTAAYLFSPLEQHYYEREFGSRLLKREVIGIPRHDPQWMRRVIDASESAATSLGDGFVTLISRPGGSGYLPLDRKRQSLADIRRVVIEEQGLRVVVKLHPKERREGLFEEVFGRSAQGTSWSYTDVHPFALARRSVFALTFYSGVCVDMIACGTPVIECLNLRGLPGYDTPDALRDETGEPVFSYRYLGLAMGASTRAALHEAVRTVMTDHASTRDLQTARYREFFPTVADATGKVAGDVAVLLRDADQKGGRHVHGA